MTSAGYLDRRIQFRRYTETDDGFQKTKVWADHGSPVWAKKTDVSDSERLRSGEVSAMLSTRWVVRSSAFTRALTPKDALAYEGRTFEIFGIKEQGRRDYLEITTAAQVD
jgi:head-tail adaptor